MPIYEYGCQSCGHQLDVTHGVHQSGPSACPVCGGPLRKLLSTPTIVFKGSGWAKKERGGSQGRAAGAGAGESKKSGDNSSAAPDKSGADDKPAGSKAGADD